MWSNFHTHSHFCDGKGTPKDYLNAGERSDIVSIGFSSHAPIPFDCKWCMQGKSLPVYLQEIELLKAAFPTIEIYKGLEIDFIPEIISPDIYKPFLDYTIGAIHFVDGFEGNAWEIDGSHAVFKEGLQKIFNNNIQLAITRYYELTRTMILEAPPDIIGHLDKIKIQNVRERLYEESESWYIDEIEKTLAVIKQANRIVEVNTRGLYQKKSNDTYPSSWILERIHELNIPITLSSDAHHPDDLISQFQQTASLLSDIGFKTLSVLKGGRWRPMPFNNNGLIQ